MGRKSLLSRIDKGKKDALFSKSKASPTTREIYRDINHALGVIFKMILPFIPGGESAMNRAQHKAHKHKSKKSKKSMLGRIGI